MCSLAVFRGIRELKTMDSLMRLLKEPTYENAGEFAANLYRHSADLTGYVSKAVSENENEYLRRLAVRREVPAPMERSVERELLILERLSLLRPEDIPLEGIAGWDTDKADFRSMYRERVEKLFTKGFGIYSKHTAFMLKGDDIVPVLTPDPQRLSELHSYELQRKQVVDNTLALINGLPAANALLYGDAGTGKSSTVKAVVNEFADRGLRLIEIKKSQLTQLPLVMEQIVGNPLKFIIFIDDLSFATDDEDFGMLKAVLEGSVSAKADNAVIYATSNRRHLLKERFADRSGDDVHAGDTRQEQASLSERFGLRVTFLKPDKQVYLEIVEELAKQYGIDIPREELFAGAESYALRRSGRSGRAARHYVESLKSGRI